MKITLDRTEPIAQNIFMFWFKPDKSIRQVAGQFIELKIPHDNKDSRGEKRWFTLSSSPTEPLVAITTKITEESSSFKKALRSLKAGDVVDMSAPMGDFVLPKKQDQPTLLVAGGIGCTPYRSMITYLKDSQEQRNIRLLYAVNNAAEIAFADTFSAYLKDDFVTVINQPPAHSSRLSGRIDGTMILSQVQDQANTLVYLSGPEPMVNDLATQLKNSGFNKKNIKSDVFPGYETY
ncbi:MAG: hypothetical protein NVS1B7_0680 [Candidatus Saccharimonadales bacterium]